MTISLTERLAKIKANRARLQATIALKSGRRQAVSYEYAKLVRETVKQIRAEMKLERQSKSEAA